MYYIYVLRCSDNSLYTGITTDFKKRYTEHITKAKTAAKYTRSHDVLCVEAVWNCDMKSDALKLERRIKSLPKPKKERLIQTPGAVNSLGLCAQYNITDKSLLTNGDVK